MLSIKRFSSTELGKQNLKADMKKLWQEESYDHIVRDRDELLRTRKYIEANPRKAGLRETEFSYYRAAWLDDYAGLE